MTNMVIFAHHSSPPPLSSYIQVNYQIFSFILYLKQITNKEGVMYENYV